MMRSTGAFSTPPVVKNLIILNVLFFMAEMLLPGGMGDRLIDNLALHYWESENFRLYQFVSYMFLHADMSHLFFNMFALWMFGRGLEYDLGSSRFLTYYMITGIGAGLIQLGVNWFDVMHLKNLIADPTIATGNIGALLYAKTNMMSIGASGAVFGILLAFGMMHPNATIMLLFPPIPIRAKWFVIGYGVIELFLGVSGRDTGVAHFAHLGGMIFGFLLLVYWKRKGKIYY